MKIFSRVSISSLRSVRSTWKVLDDVTPNWEIWDHHLHNVSLKGNACLFFCSQDHNGGGEEYCCREEQLAVLYQHCDARETTEISVTDKIGPDVVSWTKFLKVVSSICVHPSSSSFFIDVEKKIVVVFLLEKVRKGPLLSLPNCSCLRTRWILQICENPTSS
ncbi:hypothetical protein YC2023_047252 [Brassica napus]